MADKDEQTSAMLVQKHQLEQSEDKLSELDAALSILQQSQETNDSALDRMLNDMQGILSNCGIEFDPNENSFISLEVEEYVSNTFEQIEPVVDEISVIQGIDFNRDVDWQQYMSSVESYSKNNGIDLTVDPFKTLMTPTQRVAFEKRVKDEFSLKNRFPLKKNVFLSLENCIIF